MDDLISREAAVECAIDAVDDWDGGWNPNRETVIRKYFAEVPAVDAAPVVHGRWVSKNEEGVYGPTYCSICDFELRIDDTPYCPMCGARMDGDTDG